MSDYLTVRTDGTKAGTTGVDEEGRPIARRVRAVWLRDCERGGRELVVQLAPAEEEDESITLDAVPGAPFPALIRSIPTIDIHVAVSGAVA